jgi:RNA polymerase sigma factor (sigma-70 family)
VDFEGRRAGFARPPPDRDALGCRRVRRGSEAGGSEMHERRVVEPDGGPAGVVPVTPGERRGQPVPSDEALVLACRRGDAAGWEMLIRRYRRLVYSIPRRAGLDDDAAADVFQNVFTALVTSLDRISQPARIGAWLTTTARRETWRQRRHARLVPLRPPGAGDDAAAIDHPDDALAPEEALLRWEERQRVRAAVAALDERSRRLVTLLFSRAEPPPYAAIASALGVPEGSIGPTRARCLRKLRRLLDAAAS